MKHEICRILGNNMTVSRSLKVLILTISPILIVVGVLSWVQVQEKSSVMLISTPTPDPFHTYDPATYGIPATIAGYKVLAVQTSTNTACTMPGTMRLILQATEPDLDSFLANTNPQAVMQELEKLDISKDVKWQPQYVGPSLWDREKFISQNNEWNESRKAYGCLRTGPIILTTITPES